MKVIFGLGNPEQQYTGTRHNVGFWATTQLAEQWGASYKVESKHSARVATATVAGEKVLLVQPQTYYNEVGRSARSIMDFYKLTPSDFLIVHDDLALPLGTIRTRIGGSSGGNNGLKSLQAHLGQDTARLRVGVWVEHHHATDNVSIVLGKFSQGEAKVMAEQMTTIATIASEFAADTFATTTHK